MRASQIHPVYYFAPSVSFLAPSSSRSWSARQSLSPAILSVSLVGALVRDACGWLQPASRPASASIGRKSLRRTHLHQRWEFLYLSHFSPAKIRWWKSRGRPGCEMPSDQLVQSLEKNRLRATARILHLAHLVIVELTLSGVGHFLRCL